MCGEGMEKVNTIPRRSPQFQSLKYLLEYAIVSEVSSNIYQSRVQAKTYIKHILSSRLSASTKAKEIS
jgi:hypothetical protein